MKKYLPYIFTLILVVGILVPTHITHAGSWFDLPSPTVFIAKLLKAVILALLTLLSWLMGFSGTLLNFVMEYTIVDMANNIKGLTGINVAWKILRDLMNIAFIFILVYDAILLIIDQYDIKKIRDFIFMIVISSLLINFSLFFTKVLIDASNIVTIGLHNAIIARPPGSPPPPGTGTLQYGISDVIAGQLGVTSIYIPVDASKMDASLGGDDPGKVLIAGIGTAIILVIATFVFFAVAMMLIVRFLTLLFLLMLSPIAYMGMALPEMKTYSNEWWSSLKGQLLFPPIFMALLLVVLTLMKSGLFLSAGGMGSFSDVTDTETVKQGYLNLILNFTVLIGLLVASLVTAKKWAKLGSTHIGNATNFITKKAGSAVAGTSARFGRATVGRAGNYLSNSEYLKDKEVNGNFASKALARSVRFSGDKAASGSFDVRTSRVGSAVSSQLGTDFGSGTLFNSKAGKEGYKGTIKEDEKKRTTYAKSLKPTDESIKQRKDAQNAANNAAIEDIKKDAQEASDEINSEEFKLRESKAKEDKFNSEEYINSENGKALKAKTDHESAEEKLKQSNEELAKKEKELDSTLLSDSDKQRIRFEAEQIRQRANTEKADANRLKLERDKVKDIITAAEKEQESFKSDEKNDLERRQNLVAREKEQNDNNKKEIEKIDATYSERVGKYADKVESGGFVTRQASKYSAWIGGVVGGATGAVTSGGAGATVGTVAGVKVAQAVNTVTSTERTAMATKIRAIAKPKDKKDSGPSKDEKDKAQKTINDPEASDDDKKKAWETLGVGKDDE